MEQNVADERGRVIPIAIEDELKESYLNYAMSVIVSRALPDVRDGLKPVHRRILWGMSEMGLRPNTPFKKCGRIVGDVLGKTHPHGDQSIYDALVRLAQPFSMRYPVVNGQGNFGSVDGDPPAAMRYTEAKMQSLAEEMLRDIKKETVDFGPNYDDTLQEPTVLPGAFPYLLANGASGIAVGMATNIPPHNIREIADAISAVIENPNITIDELLKHHITAPDFPTGGIIYGTRGIREAYKTGRGKITIRSRFSIESNKSGRDIIVIHEIPYQVNKATMITRIADLVRDKRIEGISDLRDESDRNGLRVIIELKKGVSPKIILNQLFTHTQLQVNFNVNALALADGKPKLLNIKDMIQYFIQHRRDVVIRRAKYDLRKAEERAHILRGLKIALDNIDEVIQIIKESKDVETARGRLMTRFALDEVQAQAILDMRLQRLTSLETQKIIDELEQVLALIEELKALLASEEKILNVVKEETEEIAQKYGDERRTEVVPDEVEQIDIEDLIQKEDMVVVITHRGFVKRTPYSAYRIQGRGGKGSRSTGNLRDDDFIQHIFIGSTHDHILFLTNEGKAYWIKVHEIPEAARTAKGTHIKSILEISANEEIASVAALRSFEEELFLFFATRGGTVKKSKVADFANARKRGITAINLKEGDTLVTAFLTTGSDSVFLVTRQGRGLLINEEEVRPMGRASQGVAGVRLRKGDELAGAVSSRDAAHMFLLTEFGFGKRTEFEQFTPHGRGTTGQIAYGFSEDNADRTGEVVGLLAVNEDDELVAITSQGSTVRLRAGDISVQGRSARGVRVFNIDKPDYVVSVTRAAKDDGEEENAEEPK
ncbi:MAG: DNA topoisomerase (ATP-hydrolyzing) subunit A [Alkalispirochaetaceae bacterium]